MGSEQFIRYSSFSLRIEDPLLSAHGYQLLPLATIQ